MRVDDLDYHLPKTQIAQSPLDRRDDSRLLRIDRNSGTFADDRFTQLAELLRGDELLVLNNARVIPARLFGRRLGVHSGPSSAATKDEPVSGKVEIFLVRKIEKNVWQAMVRPGRRMQVGARVEFGAGELEAEIVAREERGLRLVGFLSRDARSVEEHFQMLGHMPLPPYIDRADEPEDRERYQTVFAKAPGAIAAPTAGLHFTPEILEKIRKRGVQICELTLDVGLGTFQPVRSENLESHQMHAETYQISAETAEQINTARKAGRPIVAIGTTVVRALEDAALRAAEASGDDLLRPGSADARIFITPGFRFRVVDVLLTNFHLPRSTLLALVCAFAGRETIMAAYEHAVAAGYRFYSYGDCMLIR